MFGFGQKVESISIEDVLEQKLGPIIDVREPEEFATLHVPEAQNIPMMGLMMNAEQFINKEQTYYIICRSGSRSMSVCQTLNKKGYKAINITGGTLAYAERL